MVLMTNDDNVLFSVRLRRPRSSQRFRRPTTLLVVSNWKPNRTTRVPEGENPRLRKQKMKPNLRTHPKQLRFPSQRGRWEKLQQRVHLPNRPRLLLLEKTPVWSHPRRNSRLFLREIMLCLMGVRGKFLVSLHLQHRCPNERPVQRKRNLHMKIPTHSQLRKWVMFRRHFPRERQQCEQRQQQSPLPSRRPPQRSQPRQRPPQSQRRKQKPVLGVRVLRARVVHRTGSLWILKHLCLVCLMCVLWVMCLMICIPCPLLLSTPEPTPILWILALKIPMATWWILTASVLMPSRRSCSACGLAMKLGLWTQRESMNISMNLWAMIWGKDVGQSTGPGRLQAWRSWGTKGGQNLSTFLVRPLAAGPIWFWPRFGSEPHLLNVPCLFRCGLCETMISYQRICEITLTLYLLNLDVIHQAIWSASTLQAK